MPILRPSGSDFTALVKAAAQYVPAGTNAVASKSGSGAMRAPAGLGAVIRTSQLGALVSPTTSAVIINGITPITSVAAILEKMVTTLAGNSNASSVDGTGIGASFRQPRGIAYDPTTGDLIVADMGGACIRRVTSLGVVTTIAGSGTHAFADGTGTAASFSAPYGLTVLSTGIIVVGDSGNNRIRLITPAGVVTTLAGQTTGGVTDGTGSGAQFNYPAGVAVLRDGTGLVVTELNNCRIRKVTLDGVVTTIAGSTRNFADGTGTAAKFNSPEGVAVDPITGNIIVADAGNHRIRHITYPGGVVTTLAGSTYGFADGTGTGAKLYSPRGVAVFPNGNIVIGDAQNKRIRFITPAGVVSTIAGGIQGFADGTAATSAKFDDPSGVAVLPNGTIAVADHANQRIRLIT